MSRRAALVVGAQAGDLVGDLLERRLHAGPDGRALLGDDEHPHAAVVLGLAALDEALRGKAVDEPGDVRAVALQRLREGAHRHRPLGVQLAQREELRRGEAELAGDPQHPRPHLPEEARHERPGLTGGGAISDVRSH